MQISSSLDWADVRSEFTNQIRRSTYDGSEYRKNANELLVNISHSVTLLSYAELQTRRVQAQYMMRTVDEHVANINNSIRELEQWLLICALAK